MSLTLVVQDKEGKVSSYALNSELVLGRADTVDVSLLSKNVSRRHAKVRLQGKKILVEDLGSSNGVLVNGTKIGGPTEITAGSEFQIGEFTVKIESKEPEVSSDNPIGSLIGQNGTFLDKVLPLKQGDNIVGRGSECDIFVADGSISRKHAIMSIAGDKISVRDMGSANGSFVNGQKIQDTAPVQHGEVVRFGSLSFRIELASAPIKMPSAPQPISKQVSAPQPIAPKPASAAAPVVNREPSGAAQARPATPVAPPQMSPAAATAAPSGPVDWIKVGALLATPLALAFLIGILGWRIFGSSGTDLDALRAQMSTGPIVEKASALKGENKFTEAEALLLPVLAKNPGDSTARALYNAVHDEAENQRALEEAKALAEQKNNEAAIEKLSSIEEDSFFYAEAKTQLQTLQKSPLAALLKGAAASCEEGDYQSCLDDACEYITTSSETDPELINFARVAYGLKLQTSGPGEACVKDPIQPPNAEKNLADIEKNYSDDPRKEFMISYLNGQSPQEIATQLQEASIGAGNAGDKKTLSEASAALGTLQSTLDIFTKRLNENDLASAEKAARSIWESEQKLFRGFDGPTGSEARKKLLEAHSKAFAMRELEGLAGLEEGKAFIKKMASLDSYNNSPLRYAMAARYQARLREVYDGLAERTDSKAVLDKVIPFMNPKSKLRILAQQKSEELTPR